MHISGSNKYPALPLSDVQKILDAAWNGDEALYHRIILQLSTCVQVVEMDRLSKDHLLDDGLLCYDRKINGVWIALNQ